MFRKLLVPCVAIAILALPTLVAAQGSLRLELSEVAKSVKKTLDAQGEKSVSLGQFTSAPHLQSSAGPGVAKTLSEELGKVGVTITVRAKFAVEGRFKDATDSATKQIIAHLKVKIVDRQDKVVSESDRAVFGDAAIANLLGVTAALPVTDDRAVRTKAIEQAIDKPEPQVAATRVSAGAGSPYGIEVLVRSGTGTGLGQPRSPTTNDGLAFVPIERGEVYQVRLYNDSDHEAAAGLNLDGLSMFSFSEAKDPTTMQPRYSVVIIPPNKSIVIPGWHVTNEKSDEFQVSEYAKSAAAELKSTSNVGTINAVFMAAWPKGGTPPSDEPASSRSADATGRGARIDANYQEVERVLGMVRASVTVRYSR